MDPKNINDQNIDQTTPASSAPTPQQPTPPAPPQPTEMPATQPQQAAPFYPPQTVQGTTAPSGTDPAQSQSQQWSQQPQNTMITEADIASGKGIAWLSYFGILFLIPLLTQKENPYTKFHVKQGIALFISEVVIWTVGGFIPILGWFIIIPLSMIFTFVLTLIGMINALSGKAKPLPLIGKLGEKFNF